MKREYIYNVSQAKYYYFSGANLVDFELRYSDKLGRKAICFIFEVNDVYAEIKHVWATRKR